MGAVQKLATVVIVGLVGLATLLVVYLANEPNRRAAEAVEQEEVAIQRGITTYTQNCVVCHGPAGEGYSEPGADGTGRIGAPLGGSTEAGIAATELNQSEDETTREERYNLIVETLQQGRANVAAPEYSMPAFGRGAEGGALLNDEQIHELATMIQHVDWDEVYNYVAAADGGYPTFPPAPVPPGGAEPTPAPAPAAAQGEDTQDAAPAGAVAAVTLEGYDIGWRAEGQDTAGGAEVTVRVAPGATITLPNLGASPHNFAAEAFAIDVDMPVGQTVEAAIPADAAPGEYEFICNVPGHAAAGMVGTLLVEEAGAAPAADAGAAPAEAAPAGDEAAPAEGEGAAPAAPAPVTLVGVDIAWEYDGARSGPGNPIAVPAAPGAAISLPNEGATVHNFAVDALGVDVDMPVGETVEATIPADAAPGEYEFYCNVPGHAAAGMVGTLTIG